MPGILPDHIQQYTFHKTRIAPTPSGFLHLGNILSFAITAAIASHTHARILLRIDDLDRNRARKEYIDDIFDTLRFLDIPWEQGPADTAAFESTFSQLHRLPHYHQALQELVNKGQVYACTCSRSQIPVDNGQHVYPGTCRTRQLPLDTPGACWRLYTDNQQQLIIQTPEGPVTSFLPADMQDFIIRKKDGFPAYQLTSLVDDLLFETDLVVRGQDLWHSTLAQLYLAGCLPENNFAAVTFYHHPLLMATGGEKLSKSAGATSVQYLRRQGKTRADIYTLLAGMLGRSTPVDHWQQLVQVLREGQVS